MSFKILLGALLLVVCGGSVAWRASLDTGSPEPSGAADTAQETPSTGKPPTGASGLLPGGVTPTTSGPGTPDSKPDPAPQPEPAPKALEEWLPVITESSFFAFIGFALGYFSRKVLKLAMIFIALLFIVLQVLSYGGVVTIEWSRAIEILNDWILNLKENQTVSEVLKDRIPAAGGLFAGVLLGWRKG